MVSPSSRHTRISQEGKEGLRGEMQMVILAGGLGTRMRPLTEGTCKSMLRVKDKPFLEYQIELMRENRVTDILLCVGHLSHQIKEYFDDGKRFGVVIRYSEESGGLLGMAGALKNAVPLLSDEFLAMNGDSYLRLDYGDVMSYFQNRNKLALAVVYKNGEPRYRNNIAIEGEMICIYDRNNKSGEMAYIDAGLWAMRKRALSLIPTSCIASQDEFFNKLIERDELLAFETRQHFYEIGSFHGLDEFSRFIERGVRR